MQRDSVINYQSDFKDLSFYETAVLTFVIEGFKRSFDFFSKKTVIQSSLLRKNNFIAIPSIKIISGSSQ